MTRSLLLAALLTLLSTCAATQEQAGTEPARRLPTDAEVEQYNAQVKPEERIVCREEIRIGTNIPERVCRLVQDMEETSSFHREQLRNVLR